MAKKEVKQEEVITNPLVVKLSKIQQELKVPKEQFNKFANFKYRSQEDILEAIKPLLAEHGLLLVLSDIPVLIGERYYIKATARLSDQTDYMDVEAYARESEGKKGMDDSQVTGTASSYARKYALNGLFLIDDTRDVDSKDNSETNPELFKKLKLAIQDVVYMEELESLRQDISDSAKELSSSDFQEIVGLAKKKKEILNYRNE